MPFFSVVISNSLLTGPTFPIIPVVYYSQASSLKFSNIKNEVFKTREENILPSTSIQLSLTSDVHNFYTPFFLNIAHTTTHHTSATLTYQITETDFQTHPFFKVYLSFPKGQIISTLLLLSFVSGCLPRALCTHMQDCWKVIGLWGLTGDLLLGDGVWSVEATYWGHDLEGLSPSLIFSHFCQAVCLSLSLTPGQHDVCISFAIPSAMLPCLGHKPLQNVNQNNKTSPFRCRCQLFCLNKKESVFSSNQDSLINCKVLFYYSLISLPDFLRHVLTLQCTD